jgi:L-amino acid N-acyltransferase YncA
MLPEHADQVLAIYQAGIDEGDATFDTAAPSWETFDAEKLPEHRLVAIGDAGLDDTALNDTALNDAGLGDAGGRVLGWVAVARVSRRPAYAGVVEHSVYVHPAARGRGVGLALLTTLIAATEAAGIWSLRSGIFPENTASLALHQRAGFRVVGTRDRPGRLRGRWRDVVLVERRSPTIT